jgi:hypothetical protein
MLDYMKENKDYYTAYKNIENVLIDEGLNLNDLGFMICRSSGFLTDGEYYTIENDIKTTEDTLNYLACGLSENYGDYSQYNIYTEFLFNSNQKGLIEDFFRFLRTLSIEERQPFKEVYKRIKYIQNVRSF